MKFIAWIFFEFTDRLIRRVELILPSNLLIKFRRLDIYFLRHVPRNASYKFNTSRIYYGQKNEDLLMAKFLPEAIGTYFDVGAGQPVVGNNTFFLYQRGWSGILIDPITSNRILSRLFRPRDTFYQHLIFSGSGSKTFFEMYPYEFSTIYLEMMAAALEKGATLVRSRILPVSNLNDFVGAISPYDPCLFSIDIEGADLEVIENLDLKKFQPRVICVEYVTSGLQQQESDMVELLTEHNYEIIERTSLSLILVHKLYLANQKRG
jgi:hypothetical protein